MYQCRGRREEQQLAPTVAVVGRVAAPPFLRPRARLRERGWRNVHRKTLYGNSHREFFRITPAALPGAESFFGFMEARAPLQKLTIPSARRKPFRLKQQCIAA